MVGSAVGAVGAVNVKGAVNVINAVDMQATCAN